MVGKSILFSSPVFGASILLASLVVVAATPVQAQTRVSPPNSAAVPAVEQGVRWQELQPAQRAALKPLERNWGSISSSQKQKWLEIAARFPSLPADEKTRIQARMADWTQLTPEQRGEARLNFQQAKQVSPQDRQAQWEAYQALSPEEKRKLAARAVPPAKPVPANDARKGDGSERGDQGGRGAQQTKSNIVPNFAFSAPPKPVAPTVLQAQPGATTTLISKRPVPPPHQQTGLPKIAASPNFVDKATLLPQRGPQGAATRSAGASAPEATQRR